MILYSQLNVPVNISDIQQEVATISQTWMPHFNNHHYNGSWNVIALRSPGGLATDIIPDNINEQHYQDTALLKACPAINALLLSFACPKMSVRLLNLTKGSSIKEHRDLELCFEQGEARIHIPVHTNQLVRFYLNDELIPMREGECWYINANVKHRVINNSSFDRIHLVIDLQVNEWLKQLFNESNKVEMGNTVDYTSKVNMIKELRLQNTETANRLADAMEKELC